MRRSPSKKSEGALSVRIRKISGASDTFAPDKVAIEEPLEIRLDNRPVTVTMRTPGADKELAAGFLFTEGILQKLEQITSIEPHPRNAANIINLFSTTETILKPRRFLTSASCGICGKASIADIRSKFPPLKKIRIKRATLEQLPAKLTEHQSTFDQTGGLHAAAIFSADGDLLVLREDIGRHNAVDKVIGHLFLAGALPLSKHILMVSGRTSFEILQKALAAGIPVVAAVSAPSSLAVQFARKNNQVLIGFLREGRMNIYSGRDQVI